MKVNINILKEYIQKEGLRLIKESDDNLKKLESIIEELDEGFLDRYEKKLEGLKKDEKDAIEKQDFSRLKEIKDEQIKVIDELIKFYNKKVEVLSRLGKEIKGDANEVITKGVQVFNDKNLKEFQNEEILKDTKIKIVGSSSYFIAQKVSENNIYNVLESNITGIEPGYFLKISDIKIGGPGQVTVYRKSGDKFDELKTMKFNNVTEIIKNPS